MLKVREALESLGGLVMESKTKIIAAAALVSPLLTGCEAKRMDNALGYLGFFIIPAILAGSILKDVVDSVSTTKRNK